MNVKEALALGELLDQNALRNCGQSIDLVCGDMHWMSAARSDHVLLEVAVQRGHLGHVQRHIERLGASGSRMQAAFAL